VCFYAYLYFWVEAVACHLQISQLSDSVDWKSVIVGILVMKDLRFV
jgi:hypothetical protein